MTTVTPALLDELAFRMDPEVDDVVAAWFAAGSPGAIRALHSRETDVPEVRAFLDARPKLPRWHDPALVRRGQELFAQWAPEIGLALFVGSLPAAYAGARGAAVLAGTGRLMRDPKRRIFETAQFLVHLMDRDALEPGGRAFVEARRIRLLHGAVRHLLSANGWDAAAHGGEPVNQEDLLGTLWTFSLVTLDVLAIAGVDVAPADADAYVHLWQVAGFLMGVDPTVLPMTRAEAAASFDLIRDRQYSASEDGHELARALTDTIESMIPVHVGRHLAAAAIHHYAGERVGTLLGLPAKEGWLDRHLFAVGRDLDRLGELTGHGPIRWTTEQLGRMLWSAVIAAEEHGRTSFEMPASLATTLGG